MVDLMIGGYMLAPIYHLLFFPNCIGIRLKLRLAICSTQFWYQHESQEFIEKHCYIFCVVSDLSVDIDLLATLYRFGNCFGGLGTNKVLDFWSLIT